jgi:hypothetical protein
LGLAFEDYETRWRELENEATRGKKVQQLDLQLKNHQLRTLLVDPDWELYAQEIDKRLEVVTAACDNLAKKMLEGDLDIFKKLMPDYRYNLGIKKAFEEALLIVKEAQTS